MALEARCGSRRGPDFFNHRQSEQGNPVLLSAEAGFLLAAGSMLTLVFPALALPPQHQNALSPSDAVSLSSAPTHATTLAATDPVSLLLVDYYERMTAQGRLPSIPLLPGTRPKDRAALAAFPLVYDPSIYPGIKCESWCDGDVAIDEDAARAGGRVTFPADGLAEWNEKCSWDRFCAGCAQCNNASVATGGYKSEGLGQCAAMCDVISNADQSPGWKNQTRPWTQLCNWGPCYGCPECLPSSQSPPPAASPAASPAVSSPPGGTTSGVNCTRADMSYSKYCGQAIEGYTIAKYAYAAVCECEARCAATAGCVAYVDNQKASPPHCTLKSGYDTRHDGDSLKFAYVRDGKGIDTCSPPASMTPTTASPASSPPPPAVSPSAIPPPPAPTSKVIAHWGDHASPPPPAVPSLPSTGALSSSPPPPSPSPPPVAAIVQVSMTAAGDVSDYDAAAQASLVSNMAATLNVPTADVALTVTAASVNLVFKVAVADETEAEAVAQQADSSLGTAADATTALGVSVQSAPVTATVAASPLPPAGNSLPPPAAASPPPPAGTSPPPPAGTSPPSPNASPPACTGGWLDCALGGNGPGKIPQASPPHPLFPPPPATPAPVASPCTGGWLECGLGKISQASPPHPLFPPPPATPPPVASPCTGDWLECGPGSFKQRMEIMKRATTDTLRAMGIDGPKQQQQPPQQKGKGDTAWHRASTQPRHMMSQPKENNMKAASNKAQVAPAHRGGGEPGPRRQGRQGQRGQGQGV